MNSVFRHVRLQGLVTVVPSNKNNIEDELEFFGGDIKKLARARRALGYGTRHVVKEGVTALDLCEHAARHLLRELRVDGIDVDTLLLVEQSPDYPQPNGACILQHRLGLPENCAALSINQGCPGYVQGLWLAHALIASGASSKILLCAGDTPSMHSDRRNRLVNPLFGDAGAATLLTRTDEESTAWFDLGTDGSGWSEIAIPAGGARLPLEGDMLAEYLTDKAGNPWRLHEAFINGPQVFDFSVHAVPQTISRVLTLANKGLADIDFIAMHQANKQILDEIALRLGLERGAIYSETFSRYGNQSTASVAAVLCDALTNDVTRKADTVLLCGFGIGFAWASAILDFGSCRNLGIVLHDAPEAKPTRDDLRQFWENKFLRGN